MKATLGDYSVKSRSSMHESLFFCWNYVLFLFFAFCCFLSLFCRICPPFLNILVCLQGSRFQCDAVTEKSASSRSRKKTRRFRKRIDLFLLAAPSEA